MTTEAIIVRSTISDRTPHRRSNPSDALIGQILLEAMPHPTQ